VGKDRDDRVQRVKAANDIVDVLGGYVTLRLAGQVYKGLCPFHDDHRPSFTVDPRFQNYRCWACGKFGDVLNFIQEHEKVSFLDALELLARRAGITLEKNADSQQKGGRAFMLEVIAWAAKEFHHGLVEAAFGESARVYLGERKLNGDTVRRWQLGFAPAGGQWLVERAEQAGVALETLEQVGLVGKRTEGTGYYDRFRERVMFPIRDARGQVVGFGGRILPSSAMASRADVPKYYNSAQTALFNKSENLYGIDQARQAGAAADCLVVVEGYTDVLMAHQMGIGNVVATMGTALNLRHVAQLRRFVKRIVLVFDADAGGESGVDRALEVFVSSEFDLRVAALPDGLDPCDLLTTQGPSPMQAALTNAQDVLEFKLNRVLAAGEAGGVEGSRRAVDEVLRIIALAPAEAGDTTKVKHELIVTRLAQRLGLKQETLWARIRELRAARKTNPTDRQTPEGSAVAEKVKASPLELDLLRVLLADPTLVRAAREEVEPPEIEHPRLRELLAVLYRLEAEGEVPDLDQVRLRLDDQALVAKALDLQEVGRRHRDRAKWLEEILAQFRVRRALPKKRELQNRLQAASDHSEAVELLRLLQERSRGKC
jgi:DNA primase